MPELPEVETTVAGLKGKIIKKTITDAWTDAPKIIKGFRRFSDFKKIIEGKRIENISRIGKNIIIDLSGDYILLIHQKMTGHLLLGKWVLEKEKWKPLCKGPLEDPINLYIHLMLLLNDGSMIALSDLRKFAKVELKRRKEILPLKGVGPDPLNKEMNFSKFREILKKKNGKIKKVLMDQSAISGIGNIYADEILWEAKIHPLKEIKDLEDKEIETIFLLSRTILKKAIKLKGDSMSDYRLVDGKKGGYQNFHKAYRREGKPCLFCKEKIKRIKINNRSAHFCPRCQKL